jgi:hypothetical protein
MTTTFHGTRTVPAKKRRPGPGRRVPEVTIDVTGAAAGAGEGGQREVRFDRASLAMYANDARNRRPPKPGKRRGPAAGQTKKQSGIISCSSRLAAAARGRGERRILSALCRC